MRGCVVVLNAGSSSIRFALYGGGRSEKLLYRGQVEKIGVAPSLGISNAVGEKVAEKRWPPEGFDHRAAAKALLEAGRELLAGAPVAAVGHRVVHGGVDHAAPIRVDA